MQDELYCVEGIPGLPGPQGPAGETGLPGPLNRLPGGFATLDYTTHCWRKTGLHGIRLFSDHRQHF
jgi:hypothetical protein